MKKKATVRQIDLHILIEEKSAAFRAYCLEFDLAVSGNNQEQAMVRMENIVFKHLAYAREHQSNPFHLAADETSRRWFEPNIESPLKKSYVLELRFSSHPVKGRANRSSFDRKPRMQRKYRENLDQLACL